MSISEFFIRWGHGLWPIVKALLWLALGILVFVVIYFINVFTRKHWGMCGKKIRWKLHGRKLILTGNGNMFDYDYSYINIAIHAKPAGWYPARAVIEKAIVSDGVNSIGDSAFAYLRRMETVVIPKSVTSIGEGAFYGCKSLTDIYYGGTKEDWQQVYIGKENKVFSNVTVHIKESST